jgi:predicted small secreted protein
MGHSVRFSISLLALSCAALTGCNMETTAPTDVVSLSYGGTFSGRVHGGQQPVGKATVELFSTGTSG